MNQASSAMALERSGLVFEIKRFALHDGPGLRTTVFLHGCPLACPWCQNPEGRGTVGVACAELGTEFRRMSVEQVLEEVLADELFYACGLERGGVTLSGGEPLSHPEFVASLLEACRARGLHTAIETCLAVPPRAVRDALPHCDLWLADLKAPDEARHRAWTGQPLDSVLSNLRLLAEHGAPTRVRIPAIPGHTAEPAVIRAISELALRTHPAATVEVVPYNPLPAAKYNRLGLNWPYPSKRLPPARLAELQAAADSVARTPSQSSPSAQLIPETLYA